MLRRVMVSLAFATWFFLNCWLAVGDSHLPYFLRSSPAADVLPAVIGWEAALTIALLAAWEVGARLRRWESWIERLFLAACAIPAGIAATALASLSHTATRAIQSRLFWPAAIAVLAFPAAYGMRRSRMAGRWARSLLLWSWPVLGTVLFQAAGATLLRYSARDYEDPPTATRLARTAEVRVVWVIFDELSQAIAFSHRPAGLELPNFDRLASESFYATGAVAPANTTMLSLPALILGEHVTRAEPDGPADLRIQTRSRAEWISWKSVPNVLDRARGAGFNSAIAGWYHPYGRLLNRSVNECFWVPNAIDPGAEETLNSAMADRAWLQISSLPLAGRIRWFSSLRYDRLVRSRDFQALLQHALAISGDPGIGLALLHLPVPHPPGIFDRAKGEIDTENPASYLDNVALADRTLGELRGAMEQSGVWDRTAVIVSADHGWRTWLWRGIAGWTAEDERFASMDTAGVPFLVKLPGESQQFVEEKHFDTVLTGEIIVAILQKSVSTTRELAAMIDRGGASVAR